MNHFFNSTRSALLLSGMLIVLLATCKPTAIDCQEITNQPTTVAQPEGTIVAYKTPTPVVIDGCGNDAVWASHPWYAMNYTWMGSAVDTTDYYGRFKAAWDENYLYLLVEVTDDALTPTLADGLENYWKGDYVEVFIDEDQSGGNHQYNHQAFAYHVSTDGHAIDKNTQQETVMLDSHVHMKRSQQGNRYFWEMAIQLFDATFDENSSANLPVRIKAQKQIGFSIAYGDNDGNHTRELFAGSKKTHGSNNDEGYINADVFGRLTFVEK